MKTDSTIRASLLFISFFLAIYSMYVMRDLITPFALAIFIWLIIDGFARWIDSLSPKLPYWLALTLALLIVALSLVGVVLIVADTGIAIANDREVYTARLTEIFAGVNDFLLRFDFIKDNVDLSAKGLDQRFGLVDAVEKGMLGFASAITGVLQNFIVIAIYVAFLFAAQSSFPKKMDDLFPELNERSQAGKVAIRIRRSIEKYLGVQTLMSLIQTILSYIVMTAFGLDNALFWAMVIFILNYIPIIGGILAVVMPILFAVLQFETMTKIGGLAGGLFLVQFIINNTIQPKMMGDSMNMSALVVVLSLVLWTALWGGVGAFLSAPLTVIIMIILAQFASTRWISVLLSADGHPDMDDMDKMAAEATASM